MISALWLGGAALSDFIIAVSTTYYLWRNDTGFRETHLLIVKLIRLTIETGSLTAAIALVNLALFFAFPGRPYFFTAGALLPKLYANTIFAVLNSRFEILGGRGYTSMDAGTYQSFIRNNGGTSAGGTTTHPPVVTITREIFADRELNINELVEMRDAKRSVDTSRNSVSA